MDDDPGDLQRTSAGAPAPALPGSTSPGRHGRSRELLGQRLPAGTSGESGTLHQAPVARGPAHRHPDARHDPVGTVKGPSNPEWQPRSPGDARFPGALGGSWAVDSSRLRSRRGPTRYPVSRVLTSTRYLVGRDLASPRCFVIRGWHRLDTSLVRDQGQAPGSLIVVRTRWGRRRSRTATEHRHCD